jgi:hypothetical protein
MAEAYGRSWAKRLVEKLGIILGFIGKFVVLKPSSSKFAVHGVLSS